MCTYVTDNLWFQKATITQLKYINVQQILVVTFEFTGAAHGLMIMSCAARGVKKVGQHWAIVTIIYTKGMHGIFVIVMQLSLDKMIKINKFDYCLQKK